MANESNKTVVWIVVVGVVLLLAGVIGYAMINSNINNVGVKADSAKQSADQANAAANQAVSVAGQTAANMPTSDSVATALASKLNQNTQVIGVSSGGFVTVNGQYTLRNWGEYNRNAAESEVMTLINQYGNYRELWAAIGSQENIYSPADIKSVVANNLGTVTTNIDPNEGDVYGRQVYVPMIITVKYQSNGYNGGTYTQNFVVHATLSDLENGFTEATLNSLSVQPVPITYAL